MSIKTMLKKGLKAASVARGLQNIDIEKDLYINDRGELVLRKSGMKKMKGYLHSLPVNIKDIPTTDVFRPLRKECSKEDADDHLREVIRLINKLHVDDIACDRNGEALGLHPELEAKIVNHVKSLGMVEKGYGFGWLNGGYEKDPQNFLRDIKHGLNMLCGELHGVKI